MDDEGPTIPQFTWGVGSSAPGVLGMLDTYVAGPKMLVWPS